jgi:alpha-L-fucosidase 2
MGNFLPRSAGLSRLFCYLLFFLGSNSAGAQSASLHDLYFQKIPTRWDEGIPLGNGIMGAIVYQKESGKIRISLDRADLWDLRPVPEMQDTHRFRSAWVAEKWRNGQYEEVQKQFDLPYERDPGPTKIPAAALEFTLSPATSPQTTRLYLQEAVCVVQFSTNDRLLVFLHAGAPTGHWRYEGRQAFRPKIQLIPPAYALDGAGKAANSVEGQSLQRLGYQQGVLVRDTNRLHYIQPGWGGFHYEVAVRWRATEHAQEGVWSISAHYPDQAPRTTAPEYISGDQALDFQYNFDVHRRWWADFWSKSAIQVPDFLLEKQWYLAQYKLGAASRKGAPPISLQAIWTADNGNLPPWKGDFHNDLNTQMSYWSAYGANHVEEARVFTDWLWEIRPAAINYTRQYFGVRNGLNVPGVSTLRGDPMGGWIQYAFSPTVSAWLSQHYWQDWEFTRDEDYYRQKVEPWIKEAGIFLIEYGLTVDSNGQYQFDLPLSTSPEIGDNSPEAYFRGMSNYDRSLCRYLVEKNHEIAIRNEDADWQATDFWLTMTKIMPPPDTDASGLTIAPGRPLEGSHRHFSHLMAIYPLGLLHFERDSALMLRSVRHLERLGADWWTGYSYAWMGCLQARLRDGERACYYLSSFARAFCSPNSFHLNGDQSKTGLSKFEYRPFTLEGNFAFAAGLQEMLVQHYDGVLRVFPAIPSEWKDLQFENLRVEGAFLVSARMRAGKVEQVDIRAEKGGKLRFFNPKLNKIEEIVLNAGGSYRC